MTKCALPDGSLLCRYRDRGEYTDCYTTSVHTSASLADYIFAFYTTTAFRMERKILSRALAKPSTDEQVRLLAEAATDQFAAWSVEARESDQLLMSDYQGRTRSWLRVEPLIQAHGESTRLYFGSAVVPVSDKASGKPRMSAPFHALMPFHRLYSRVLLSSARARLSR